MRETYDSGVEILAPEVHVGSVEPTPAGRDIILAFARGSINQSEALTELRRVHRVSPAAEEARRAAAERRRAARASAEQLDRLRGLVRCLLENDPNEILTGNVRIIDMWRSEAREVLEQE